jgi:hypothetical protein
VGAPWRRSVETVTQSSRLHRVPWKGYLSGVPLVMGNKRASVGGSPGVRAGDRTLVFT